MKKFLLLLMCVLNSIWASAQFSGSGNGTESDPYLIYSATQLYQMNNFLNQPGIVFKLMTDIDLSDFIAENFNDESWTPIGSSSSNSFKGKFWGNNHKITSLTINKPNKDYIGLFGYVSKATISDLKLECQNISGQSYVGCLVGKSEESTISGISVTNTEIHASSSFLGGIIGDGSSTSLKNSSYVGKVIGVEYVGGTIGILAGADNSISNVKSIANVEGSVYVGGCLGRILNGGGTFESIFHKGDLVNSGNYTGGIVGSVSSATILNCTHRGNIKGESEVGGIIGHIDDNLSTKTIKRCTVAGDINGLEKVGGIIGFGYGYYNTFYVLDCSYSGKLQCTYNVGGISGYQHLGSINRCISNGASIKGTGCTGGIIGKNENVKVQNCFALSRTISASKLDSLGRISGSANANNANNMALVTTKVFSNGVLQSITDDNAKQGQSIGASILKLKATYVAKGWDMEKVWNILETESYPYMAYQTAPPVVASKLVSGATTITGSSLKGGKVYMIYKDQAPVETTCNGNTWSFTTEPLQAGATIQFYAEADDMVPSNLTIATVDYKGSGTEADPYLVYTAEDLQGAYKKGYFKLMNDIDLTSWIKENSPTKGWLPIGQNTGDASNFNGDGHKITGLWTNTTDDNVGLFSNFSSGTIKNLTVEVAKGKKVKGGNYTGIIIGRNMNGTLLNCTAKGDVEGTLNCRWCDWRL